MKEKIPQLYITSYLGNTLEIFICLLKIVWYKSNKNPSPKKLSGFQNLKFNQSLDMENRIKGLDLARTFSIFGMMVVNYHFAFGAFQGNSLLQEAANFFSGRASATFVILAGMGLILFSRKMRPKKGSVLFVLLRKYQILPSKSQEDLQRRK